MKRTLSILGISLVASFVLAVPIYSYAAPTKNEPQKKQQTVVKKVVKKPAKRVVKKKVVVKKAPPKKIVTKKVVTKKAPAKKKIAPKKTTSLPKPKVISESEKNSPISAKEVTPELKKEITPELKVTPGVTKQPDPKLVSLAGTYRCWQFNASGGGGSCRFSVPIKLSADGTYSESSTQGTYTVSGDTITFSESKIRGPGKLLGGNKIFFEYDYNSWHYTVTYLLSENESSVNSQSTPSQSSSGGVQAILKYPTKEAALGSIGVITLIPEGDDPKNPKEKYTAIAQYDGDRTIVGSFNGVSSTPKPGVKYTVIAGTGSSEQATGTIDLTSPSSGTVEAVINVSSKPSSAQQTTVQKTSGQPVDVELLLSYPKQDHSLDGITSIEITPQGADRVTTSQKYMKLAVYDGDKTVKAWFTLPSGAIYTVYTAYVSEAVNVGTLDLTNTTEKSIQKILLVTPKS